MLIATQRGDVVEAVKASEEQSRVVHVTNAEGTHTVAIRVTADADSRTKVLRADFGNRQTVAPKWYGLDSEVEMLDDITDWLALRPTTTTNEVFTFQAAEDGLDAGYELASNPLITIQVGYPCGGYFVNRWDEKEQAQYHHGVFSRLDDAKAKAVELNRVN